MEQRLIRTEVLGTALELEAHDGLFSPRHIDRGTLAMLSVVPPEPGMRVMDLGCGYGVVGIAQSRFSYSARRYLRLGGGLAAVLWLFGLLVDRGSYSNFLPLNTADEWAYFAIALVMIGLSFLSGDVTPTRKADRHS